MSSLPNTFLSPGERVHRHRRSAAISGDFDSYGLGLFSPSAPKANTTQSSDDDLDRHFQFNNDDDFSNANQNFHFPNNINAPVTKKPFASQNLTLPIRLPPKKPSSSTPNSKTKFFLTEETNMNNDNIPDAVIDLDDVLNANLHIGGNNESAFPMDDDFLASPFLKPPSSPYSSSLPAGGTLLYQPIKETTNMNDEDDEDDDNDIYDPPTVSNDFYSNGSANSSTSSIKKVSSNSTPKRSGAKATRYQSFYDQSYKVSNALKISSSESVNSIKNSPQSIKNSPQSIKWLKESRLLAHSSSLPSLKSQRSMGKILRHGDSKLKYTEYNRLSPPPLISNINIASNSLPSFIQRDNKIEISGSPKSHQQQGSKSNSPISVTSDAGSTILSANGTLQSTDRSSLVSEKQDNLPAIVINSQTDEIETLTNNSSSTASPKRSPRRPLTPNEEKILKETTIPPYKGKTRKYIPMKENILEPSKKHNHYKSKSFSVLHESQAARNSVYIDSDTASLKSHKPHKFMSWLKRK